MKWRSKQKRIGEGKQPCNRPSIVIKCDSGMAHDTIIETAEGLILPHVYEVVLGATATGLWHADLKTYFPKLYLKAWLTDEARARLITECSQMLEWLVTGDAAPVYESKDGQAITKDEAMAEALKQDRDADTCGD